MVGRRPADPACGSRAVSAADAFGAPSSSRARLTGASDRCGPPCWATVRRSSLPLWPARVPRRGERRSRALGGASSSRAQADRLRAVPRGITPTAAPFWPSVGDGRQQPSHEATVLSAGELGFGPARSSPRAARPRRTVAAAGPGGARRRLQRRHRARQPPRRLRSRPPPVPFAPVKRYHVTTFGCQMNEHDSERMKGMLESLGYAEARRPGRRRPHPLQHLLDPREGRRALPRHLHSAKRLKAANPEVVVGVGGCWAQSVKDEVFARFPFVDVAFGPGQVHRLAEFLNSDSLTAQGFFEFEGFTGRPAGAARARLPGVGADHRRLQHGLLVLHRAVDPRARGLDGRSASSSTRSGRWSADGVREVTLLGQNVNSYGRDLRPERALVRRAAARARRDRGDRPHPLHVPAPEGHARGRHPGPRGAARGLRAHPPAAAVGLDADPQGDAPHVHARALPRPRRAHPRARARLRADDRHHRRLPGGDRGGLRADARGRRGGRLRRRVHVRLLAAPRDRGGGDHRGARAARGRRSSGWSGSSRPSSAARASARSGSSGGRWTCSWRARRAPTRRACAAARGTTRP